MMILRLSASFTNFANSLGRTGSACRDDDKDAAREYVLSQGFSRLMISRVL